MPDRAACGLVYADRYLQHNPGLQLIGGRPAPFVEPIIHPSNYRLVMRTRQLLDLTGLSSRLTPIEPRYASVDDLTIYHTPDYVERVRALCAEGGGETGEGAPAGTESYEVALLAAGGCMATVDAVMSGTVRRAFANVRPPGHHAMADKGMGFCIFNNIVIAARHAQRVHGVERVMVLDWDVHHGNGTQDACYDDPSVLFCSLHQDGLYPPTFGTLEQTGAGEGAGYTVNLPLPPGCGDAAYLAAFERIVLPIAHAFEPQLVLVSAGQDASTMDPLGRMCVTSEGYRRMTQAMLDLAEAHAGGKLAIVQEGGYSDLYAPYCTLGIIETLVGERTGIVEPLSNERLSQQPQYSAVGASAEAALAAIRAAYAPCWSALAD